MGARRTAMLLMLVAGQACAQPASNPTAAETAASNPPTVQAAHPAAVLTAAAEPHSPPGAPAPPPVIGSGKRIFLPPPDAWDHAMIADHPALYQTDHDFAVLTNGLAFGMSPEDVNALLAHPAPSVSWGALPLANEYPGEVHALAIRFAAAGKLRMGVTACAGGNSTLVFLFQQSGLFRLSFRLTADASCPDTDPAAQQIFARFVPLSQRIARSVRYRTGTTHVVDITDRAADYMTTVRWQESDY